MTTRKLTDLQLILLTTAATRDGGDILPLPEQISGERARVRKVIPQLLKRLLVEETDIIDAAAVWREEDDRKIGIRITDAGRSAIGVEDAKHANLAPTEAADLELAAELVASPPPTKIAMVLGLLRKDGGATLPELVVATGWLPHTTRAALTGLRKKGHSIVKADRAGATAYSVAAAA